MLTLKDIMYKVKISTDGIKRLCLRAAYSVHRPQLMSNACKGVNSVVICQSFIPIDSLALTDRIRILILSYLKEQMTCICSA